jgi:hypothetical protein
MRKSSLIPVAVACCLSACSGGDDTVPTTATTAVTLVPTTVTLAPDLAAAYFDGLVAIEAAVGVVAPTGAVPNSDAARYAEYQVAVRDLLDLAPARSVVEAASGFQLCGPDGTCATFDDVVTDPGTGRVASFSIDGVGLAGRIVGDGPTADRDGIFAHVTTAYVANSSDVFVVIDIDNTTDVAVELFGFAAVLEPVAVGAGLEATGAWGDQRVAPGASARHLLRFPPADLGGRLRLSGLRSDGLDLSFELSVPSPGE